MLCCRSEATDAYYSLFPIRLQHGLSTPQSAAKRNMLLLDKIVVKTNVPLDAMLANGDPLNGQRLSRIED